MFNPTCMATRSTKKNEHQFEEAADSQCLHLFGITLVAEEHLQKQTSCQPQEN